MIKPLLKNSSIYLSGLMISRGVSIISYILAARILMPSGFGMLVYFITLLQLVNFIGEFGLNQWYQKQKSRGTADVFEKMMGARMLSLGISIPVSVVVASFAWGYSYISLLFIPGVIIEAFFSITDGYYLEKKKSLYAALKGASRLGFLLIGVLLLGKGLTVQTTIVLYLIGGIITVLWSYPWKIKRSIQTKYILSGVKTLHNSYPYGLLSFTAYAYNRGDSVIIGALLGNAALGIYNAGYRMLEILSIIPMSLSHNLFPVSSQEGKVEKHHLTKLIFIAGTMGFVISTLVFILAPSIIFYTVGPAYAASVPVLQILSLVLFLFFVNAPISTVVQSSQQVKRFLPFGIANTGLNILLNLLFTPTYSILAAALIMCVTETTGLLINIYFARRIYQ